MNFFRKQLLLFIILANILVVISSCNEKQKIANVKPDKGFQEYVSAFTSGVISSRSEIRIRLASNEHQNAKAGSSANAELFSFEPEIKGTAHWENSRTIVFQPEEALSNGTKYIGSFKLGELVKTNEKYQSFPLSFQVVAQDYRVNLGELKQGKSDSKFYSLTGEIATADVLENEKAESLLKAKIKNQNLDIIWSHERCSKKHGFTIENIKREQEDGELQLNWDGKEIGIDRKGERLIEIPGLNNFKLVEVKVIQQPSQFVLLTFSDRLIQQQNLKGLIRIENENNLQFDIKDNQVKIFCNKRLSGERQISIDKAIKNDQAFRLKEAETHQVFFEALKPEVRFIGKGSIIPESNGLILPFETVNLNAVDVKIIKIYEDNIAQFLQINAFDDARELKRVGRLITQKKITLNSDNLIDYSKWNAFSFDLSELVKTEPGAIYRVEISFKKNDSLYPCGNELEEKNNSEENDNWDEEYSDENSSWDYAEDYYSDNVYYSWNERQDPCSPGYYQDKKVSRNILASNLGIVAKAGNNNELKVFVTDLRTTKPIENAELKLINYQQKEIGKANTNEQGMATLSYDKTKPFLLIAKSEKQKGYLKLNDALSLSLSQFDVSGAKYDKGIKGFIYGERGVWRPGDTIFLSFILEDKEQVLPKEHPVSFELIDPFGKTVKRMVKSTGVNNFYPFKISTTEDAPTGNWLAKVKIGGAIFSKQLRVETVKPNRLKIKLDFEKEQFNKNDTIKVKLETKWLHGAVAKNLKTSINAFFVKAKTRFKTHQDYIFDNPALEEYPSYGNKTFSEKLDENGKAEIMMPTKSVKKLPGMMKVQFFTKVFEEGGNFSTNQTQVAYSAYNNYVGIKLPKGDKARGMLLTDEKHKVKVVSLNAKGEKVSLKNLEARMYKIQWRWWWQSGNDNIGTYIERNSIKPIMTKTFSTSNGEGSFDIEVKYPDWGRYLVVVETPEGHSAGKALYIDWPGWAGRAQNENAGGASMLAFSANKTKYNIGEKARVSIPGGGGARALVSIEKGIKVLKAFWVETQDKETAFEFDITKEMTPNVYINLTLIKPHGQNTNDLPLRMYGVTPIMVEDAETQITPVIEMADELRPESEVKIKVSEENGKPMTFTLAVVDEGLLDLTNFKTPDPWNYFYAREALSVRSWDLYDMVLGAYGAKIEAAFAIGGDEDLEEEAGNDSPKGAKRFKPVVEFFGPYTLNEKEKKQISFTMPRYLGAVKTMVIAANEHAYGKAHKTVPVKKPLMLYATLPRVLSPNEKVKLPVNLFALSDEIKNVNVSVETNNLLKVCGKKQQKIVFDKAGDQDFNFELETLGELGIAKVKLLAKSGKETAVYEIELDIRTPNPPKIETYSAVCKPNETWVQNFSLFGIKSTNAVTIEVSGMPPINIDKRLKFLIRYPYGCVEQTTSSVFPQLYLNEILQISEAKQSLITKNISKGIERLLLLQISNGGFAYWPGANKANEWGTNYAGHFILEAQNKGYTLPAGMKASWINYQQKKANDWNPSNERDKGLSQAYRLFTLALAGKPNLGAMNRLMEYDKLGREASCFLGISYLYSGNKDVGLEMMNQAKNEKNTKQYAHTYGSKERNLAIVLEALLELEMYDEAMPIIREISAALNAPNWMSTQTTAFCLRAMSKASKIFKQSMDNFSYIYTLNSQKKQEVKSNKIFNQHSLNISQTQKSNKLKVKNETNLPFYINLSVEGVPLNDDFGKEEKNLKMKIAYKTLDNHPIDITSLEQSTDFKAEITVQHPGLMPDYENMALTAMFPSGWEIHNPRLYDSEKSHLRDQPTYQDIRDDRIDIFFDLSRNQKKTFVVLLNASYSGEYNLPSVNCAEMYNHNIRARIPGKKVKVLSSTN